jgi:hypothetical protein
MEQLIGTSRALSRSGIEKSKSRRPPQLAASFTRKRTPRRARSAAVPGIDGGRASNDFFVPRRLVATALLARDRAAIVSFDRGSHHAAVSPRADGDAAWADADGDV